MVGVYEEKKINMKYRIRTITNRFREREEYYNQKYELLKKGHT